MEDMDEVFYAWRESEAYQVPMTDEGERLAQQRWYGFQKGWEYAMKQKEEKE